MRRDRVVDDRLDVALGQILLQPVSLDAPHGKNMEYVCILVLDSGQYDSGIVNMFDIVASYIFSGRYVFFEMT